MDSVHERSGSLQPGVKHWTYMLRTPEACSVLMCCCQVMSKEKTENGSATNNPT